MRQQIVKRPFFIFLILIITFSTSCKKEKIESREDNRVQQENIQSSKIRLINLTLFDQLIADGDSLTNFLSGNLDGYSNRKRTEYFPEDGLLSKVWQIPQNLLNGQQPVQLQMQGLNPGYTMDPTTIQIQEEGNQAIDYYFWTSKKFVETGYPQPEVLKIPRDESGPRTQGYFKIRILNLAAQLTDNGTNAEDLLDAYTLTFADGQSIDSKSSNVTQGMSSDYIELPYGTYQFRVLTQDGRQLPYGENSNTAEGGGVTDPATSSLSQGVGTGQVIAYAPIKNYMPGSAYTIVVSPKALAYPIDGGNVTYYQNAFDIIEDVAAPVNNNLAQVQAVNVLSNEQQIRVKINQTITKEVSYGNASAYEILIKGNYTLEVLDLNNQVLASSQLALEANDNVTAWVSTDQNGKIQVSLAYNNLSGTWYIPDGKENATFNRIQQSFPMNLRFFNFCPDVPYLTFTQENGNDPRQGGIITTSYAIEASAYQNLTPNTIVQKSPYIPMGSGVRPLFWLYAFDSKPNVVPGNWIPEVKPISSQDFIANKKLYAVRGQLPTHERGYFSVALVGKKKTTNPESKPKIIIVKHNK